MNKSYLAEAFIIGWLIMMGLISIDVEINITVDQVDQNKAEQRK